MPQEIERKFLIKKMPLLMPCNNFEYIRQGYIQINKDGSETRLRQQGKKYFRTEKTDHGMIRNEKSEEISKEEFEKDWPLTEGKQLEKVRFYLFFGGHIFEWDIYSGSLKGLMTVEVEFSSKEEAEKFIPPEWFGEKVTNDKNFKNCNLARWAYPTPEILELRKKRDELWAKFNRLEKKGSFSGLNIAQELDEIQNKLDNLEGDKPSERYYSRINWEMGG